METDSVSTLLFPNNAPYHPALAPFHNTERPRNSIHLYPRPLLLLPQELLLMIAELLDLDSHSALSRTCKYLAFALQGHLFRRAADVGDYPAMYYGCATPNNLPALERALYYGVPSDLNAPISLGMTSLAIAARGNCTEVVKYLIDKRADVNNTGETYLTPLSYALLALSEASVESEKIPASTIIKLLRAGANPICELPDRLKEGYLDGIPLTVVLDAHLNKRLSLRTTLQLIWELVEHGADTDGFGDRGWSPLEWAVSKDMPNLATLLLDNGADPNYGSQRGMGFTPLGKAIVTGNTAAVNFLIERGANPGPSSTTNSVSPLLYAVQLNKLECVIALLQGGASPNIVETARTVRGTFYGTALAEAIQRHRVSSNPHFHSQALDIFRTLLCAGADPNLADILGRRSLPMVLHIRHLSAPDRLYIVQQLLSHGANPNLPDQHGIAPVALCITSAWGIYPISWASPRTEILKLLVEHGADVNTCGDGMNTKWPLLLTLSTKVRGYYPRRDYERLCGLFEKKLVQIRAGALGVWVDRSVTLSQVPEDGWDNPFIPILLKAGAEVSQALLDRVLY